MGEEVIPRLQETFDEIVSGEGVPRNVQAHATSVLGILNDVADSLSSKKDKIIQIVEKMLDDPNIDMSLRVDLYNTVSFIELLDKKAL